MAVPFAGAATPLGPADISLAATELGCDPAAIKAVMTVETAGHGFLQDGSGRPEILFEAELFSNATAHQYDASHPTISAPSGRGLYRFGAVEYDRLNEAVALNRTAALTSCSWGLFQILGQNFKDAGFKDVDSFVSNEMFSEGSQLLDFVEFVLANDLAEALVAHDWTTFARRYNGPGYAANNYDAKLAHAYAVDTIGLAVPSYLSIGASGARVVALQKSINAAGAALAVDGVFGRATDIALEDFQKSYGLVVDGIVGPATAAALGLPA